MADFRGFEVRSGDYVQKTILDMRQSNAASVDQSWVRQAPSSIETMGGNIEVVFNIS